MTNTERILEILDELRARGLVPSRIEASDAYLTVDGLAPITPAVDRPSPDPVDARRPPRA